MTWVCADLFDYTPQRAVDLFVADPPYGQIVKQSWDQTTCYDRIAEYMTEHLAAHGTAYVWGGVGTAKNRPFLAWLATFEDRYPLTLHNVITWSKRRAYGTPTNYLFTREECAMIIREGTKKQITFNVPLLEDVRGYAGYNPKYPAKSEFKRRTNVWSDINELFSGKEHPTQKPDKLAEVMIATSSNTGDFVLDAFAGHGSVHSTAIAMGRECVAVERDSRWQK